jgi:hypothetical protein
VRHGINLLKYSDSICLASVKLFRERGKSPAPAAEVVISRSPIRTEKRPIEFPPIPLSPEQRAVLQSPITERVARILKGIYGDKAAAERAIKARRIVSFPFGGGHPSHAMQYDDGYWHIAPGSATPEEDQGII